MDELQLLRSQRDGVRTGLLDVLSRFSDADLAFQPFEGGRDVGSILRHLAHEEAIEVHWGLAHLTEDMPPEPDPVAHRTTSALRVLLDDAHAITAACLDGLAPGALDEVAELAWGGAVRRGDQLWHVLEHEIHHRGELSLILGLLGREGLDA